MCQCIAFNFDLFYVSSTTNFGIVDGVLKKLADEGKINIAYIGLSEANVDTMTRRLLFCDRIFKDQINIVGLSLLHGVGLASWGLDVIRKLESSFYTFIVTIINICHFSLYYCSFESFLLNNWIFHCNAN